MTRAETGIVSGRVSVIIPTFNRSVLVAEALASVEKLTWTDVEVIVIDDGSTDNTEAVIEKLRSGGFRWPLHYFWQSNAGPSLARNAGRQHARGEYIYHLDSDDLVARDAFDALIAAMHRDGTDYSVGVVENTDRVGVRLADQPFSTHQIVKGDILKSNWYTHAALYKRDVLDRIDGYNEALSRGEDTELHWRIMATAGLPAMHDGLIATRRVHDFGHLGHKKQTRIEQVSAVLEVYERFFDAYPELFCTRLNALRVLRMGMECGSRKEIDIKHRCQSILKRMTRMGFARQTLSPLSILLTPNVATYYQVLGRLSQLRSSVRRKIQRQTAKSTQPNDSRSSPGPLNRQG